MCVWVGDGAVYFSKPLVVFFARWSQVFPSPFLYLRWQDTAYQLSEGVELAGGNAARNILFLQKKKREKCFLVFFIAPSCSVLKISPNVFPMCPWIVSFKYKQSSGQHPIYAIGWLLNNKVIACLFLCGCVDARKLENLCSISHLPPPVFVHGFLGPSLVLTAIECGHLIFLSLSCYRRIRIGKIHADQLPLSDGPVLQRLPRPISKDQEDCSSMLSLPDL